MELTAQPREDITELVVTLKRLEKALWGETPQEEIPVLVNKARSLARNIANETKKEWISWYTPTGTTGSYRRYLPRFFAEYQRLHDASGGGKAARMNAYDKLVKKHPEDLDPDKADSFLRQYRGWVRNNVKRKPTKK